MDNKKICNPNLTIAILSDLHAYDNSKSEYKDNPPSWFTIGDPIQKNVRHPITDLISLIEKESIVSDFLFCAGDIGDKAYPIHIELGYGSN